MTSHLAKYAVAGHRRVEGWLGQGAVDVICEFARIQEEHEIQGPVCEIGVHQGRLFILLHLLTRPAERSLAIDLFERQDENVDESGCGARQALLNNLGLHGGDLSRIELLAENSLRLDAERIVTLCNGKPRLFSVDGGHTAEITRNDLRLARDSICEGGVVILDDYFNSQWPGVSEGTCRFMSAERGTLVPVAITSNKFFFSNSEQAASVYRSRLLRQHAEAGVVTAFDSDVVWLEPRKRTLRQRVTAAPQWVRLRQTAVGRQLLRLKRWI